MKILVVDDEALLVKGIRFNLQNEGYQVITGSNGLEALQKVQLEHPDLVVLDVMMPQAVRPSISGIITSSTTRSGCSCWTF